MRRFATQLLLVQCASSMYSPLSAPAEARLLSLANVAVHRGDHRDALRCYETAVQHGCLSRSHLLLALHYQRCGAHPEETRRAFRSGIAKRTVDTQSDAQLLQAWALFESKHGDMHRAVRLLQSAARMDRTAIGAFRWKHFRLYNQAHNPLARPSKRGLSPRDCQAFDA